MSRTIAILGAFLGASVALGQHPSRVLDHPQPQPGSDFGEAVVTLDFDGDGNLDVGVGAPGEDAAYVFFGTGRPLSEPDLTASLRFTPPGSPGAGEFGFRLAAGDLGGLGDGLVVGAPMTTIDGTQHAGAVYVVRRGLPTVTLHMGGADVHRLGASLAIADFDHDGILDIAAGAVQAQSGGTNAGRVYIFRGPVETPQVHVLDSPFPVANGNFGHRLAAGDVDGDGRDDLVVSAVGNDANGVPIAGQVFFYRGRVIDEVFDLVEDPNPSRSDLPATRFGMQVAIGPGAVLVGAPRKDFKGIHDAGLGYLFRHDPDTPPVLLHHPTSMENDLLGFRVVVGNFVGSSMPDYGVITLPSQLVPNANPLGLIVWDGGDPTTPPTTLEAHPDSGDHFANGLGAGQLHPGGFDEVLFGDPSFDLPGAGADDDTGRVVVYYPQ
ncbi:MAG: hypothetical protein GY711_04765 [bacterium]|nr:hypothetical protein [bacterium]